MCSACVRESEETSRWAWMDRGRQKVRKREKGREKSLPGNWSE